MVQAGIVSPDTPFIGEQPNKNISLCMYGDSTGLRVWNDKNDPMPIKTINMNGLQKWEETDDYIIYLDKDAVMTTVTQYVTGSYDKFMELKANVDGATELLKLNGIEWTAEDDSKLFTDINNHMLEKIINTPTQLDEPTDIQTFSSKAVPTTYECCFRTDKKTGEIYINEGYENLWVKTSLRTENGGVYVYDESRGSTTFIREDGQIDINNRTHLPQVKTKGETWTISVNDVLKGNDNYDYQWGFNSSKPGNVSNREGSLTKVVDDAFASNNNVRIEFRVNVIQPRPYGSISALVQFTKTSTPKPFVKSVMPTGKLAFVTSATDTTHTFLNKGDGVVTFENGYFSLKGEKIQQLLVYNALLTEQEKQTELTKDIKLNDEYNEYFNIRRKL